MVQKMHTQNSWVQEEVWIRAQEKGLSNGCRDFNWLLLHKKNTGKINNACT